MLGHRHPHRHLDRVVPVGLWSGQDIPSPAQKASGDQHTGRRTSFLRSSMEVLEFNITMSEE